MVKDYSNSVLKYAAVTPWAILFQSAARDHLYASSHKKDSKPTYFDLCYTSGEHWFSGWVINNIINAHYWLHINLK